MYRVSAVTYSSGGSTRYRPLCSGVRGDDCSSVQVPWSGSAADWSLPSVSHVSFPVPALVRRFVTSVIYVDGKRWCVCVGQSRVTSTSGPGVGASVGSIRVRRRQSLLRACVDCQRFQFKGNFGKIIFCSWFRLTGIIFGLELITHPLINSIYKVLCEL